MVTLSLASIQLAVQAAFRRWLTSCPISITIPLEGYKVEVTVQLVGDRFNCGIPGYNMNPADINALAYWVPENIVSHKIQGYLAPPKNGMVNVHLKGGVAVMFNFHVILA